MQLLVEQLERRVAELSRWLEAEQGPPAEVRILRGVGDEARLPDFDDRQAPSLAPDGDWREALNSTVWLRWRLRRPADWPVEDTALIAQRFGTYPVESERRIGVGLQRMQGMLYVDGRPYHTPDAHERLEAYHRQALDAHRAHGTIEAPLPVFAPSDAGVSRPVASPSGNGAGHAVVSPAEQSTEGC